MKELSAPYPIEEVGEKTYKFVLPSSYSYSLQGATHAVVEQTTTGGGWMTEGTDCYKITPYDDKEEIPENHTRKSVVKLEHDSKTRAVTLAFKIGNYAYGSMLYAGSHYQVRASEMEVGGAFLYFINYGQATAYHVDALVKKMGGPKPEQVRPLFVESRYPMQYACLHLIEQSSHTGTKLTVEEAQEIIEGYQTDNSLEPDRLLYMMAETYLRSNGILFDSYRLQRKREAKALNTKEEQEASHD